MKKPNLFPILILALMIIFMSTACYFSVKIFPRIGESTWEFAVLNGANEIATGTFSIDKRTDFHTVSGSVTFATPVATTVKYSGVADQDRNINFSITLTGVPTPTYTFSGVINAADNKVAGYCDYKDGTMQATELLHYTWGATRAAN